MRGRLRGMPDGVASLTALVRVALSASGGTPVMPLLVSWSSDSVRVMYRARRPSDGIAGYHSETISSRAFTPAAHGSGRDASVSHKEVTPTGHGPVGSGRDGVCRCAASASPAPAEVPMPPIITGWPCPRHPAGFTFPAITRPAKLLIAGPHLVRSVGRPTGSRSLNQILICRFCGAENNGE